MGYKVEDVFTESMGVGDEIVILGMPTKIEEIKLVITVIPVEGTDEALKTMTIEIPRYDFENPFQGRK